MRNRIILLAALAAIVIAVASYRGNDNTEPSTKPSPVVATPRTHVPRVPTLAAVETAAEPDRARAHEAAYRALVDALRRDPDATLAELERFLADADPSKLSTQIALGALVEVGTPAMQQALVRLVAGRASDDAFARAAIPVMAFLATPTVETEAAIRGFTGAERSEAMQTTSHLALGIMATQLARGETDRSSAIVSDYAARLAAAESTGERRRWLQVLGNARTEDAAAAVETQLADPDPAIRRSALEALRMAPGATVDGELAAALADADAEVRVGAAWALSHRRPAHETVDAMLARLAVETDDTVVEALLVALWPRRSEPRVIPAVQALARGSRSSAVRERAQQLLDTV